MKEDPIEILPSCTQYQTKSNAHQYVQVDTSEGL